jgi:leucyl-tRNA synthetase
LITSFAYRDASGRLVPADEVEEREGKFVLRADGKPCEQIIAKMSKSLKNVVNPDDVIAEYGADTLRLYEMFLGPLAASKPWNPRDVPGIFRFLQRAWRCIVEDDERAAGAGELRVNLQPNAPTLAETNALETELQRTIKKVTEDFERMAFNTAISALMIFTNKVMEKPEALNRSQAERFVLLLAPLAPHLAEELWERLGHAQTLTYEPWPKFEERLAVAQIKELVVQVNGKLRAKIVIAAETGKTEAEAEARKAAGDQLAGKTVVKVIFVPDRLVNFVVK